MEYVITKSGNWGQIYPVPEGKLAATLDKYMSYERQNAQFMPNKEWAIVHLYRRKTGRFNYGLKYIAKAIFEKYCSTVPGNTYKFTYIPILTTHINYDSERSLRPYQRDAIHALIQNYGGIIDMSCGSGKTFTLINYFKIMGLKTLLICPTKDIFKQWEEYKLPNLTVSTFQNPKLKLKGVMEAYDIVAFDECHRLPSKTILGLAMSTKTDCILVGCSATVSEKAKMREDGEDLKIFAALGRIVYKIGRKELIAQGYLANAHVLYLKPKFQTKGRFMSYPEVYDKEIVHNEDRNNLAVSATLAEIQNNRKILILVSTIAHGEIMLAKFESFKDIKSVFMNGQSKDRNRDISQYDVIIATTIYDEGKDVPSIDTVILLGSGKSKIRVTQRVGRALRVKPDGREAIIYDFDDSPVKYLKQQYLSRRKQLEEEFEVFEVDDQQKLKV